MCVLRREADKRTLDARPEPFRGDDVEAAHGAQGAQAGVHSLIHHLPRRGVRPLQHDAACAASTLVAADCTHGRNDEQRRQQ